MTEYIGRLQIGLKEIMNGSKIERYDLVTDLNETGSAYCVYKIRTRKNSVEFLIYIHEALRWRPARGFRLLDERVDADKEVILKFRLKDDSRPYYFSSLKSSHREML